MKLRDILTGAILLPAIALGSGCSEARKDRQDERLSTVVRTEKGVKVKIYDRHGIEKADLYINGEKRRDLIKSSEFEKKMLKFVTLGAISIPTPSPEKYISFGYTSDEMGDLRQKEVYVRVMDTKGNIRIVQAE